MDDAYLAGARAGASGAVARRARRPLAAVSTSPEGRPRKVKLVPVKGFRKREIARLKRFGSEVLTDGLRCWNALDGVVGSHRAIRTGSGRQAARMAPFKWVNTTLGIKSAITGTYRKLGPDHAPLPRQLRLAMQPALPAQHHDPALRSQRPRTQPIPYRALRWMTFMDKQDRSGQLSPSTYRGTNCTRPGPAYTVDWTTSVTSFASGPLPLDETPPLLVMSPPEKSAATRRLRQAGNSRLEEVQFVTAKLLRSIQLSQLNHNAESGFGGNFS